MTRTTVIRNAAWIVAWDAKESRHVYLKGGDVVFADGAITQVGGRYAGEVHDQHPQPPDQ
jgi:5-methylthioadenosine/S-adenosylhomocysteine deaminase